MTAAVLVASVDLPRHEAERLLMAATGLDRASLAAADVFAPSAVARFAALAKRRSAGEPLQYLEGTVQFGPLDMLIDERALIPRPETERLWEMAVASLGETGPGTVIVDMCTGSGNLALALKHAFPRARVYATDISDDALALAEENSARTGLEVTFLKGDLFDALPKELMGRIDLLMANPPYVADGDALPAEVSNHEPAVALFAGPKGDEVLARIADEAFWWLGVGGWLFAEIGESQSERALALFAALDREVRKDTAGRDRILVGRKGASCCS